jgi:hypothetical protein
MVKVDEKLRELRQIAPERMRIRKRRGGQRTEMTASLATEIAMLDQVIFDVGQNGSYRPGFDVGAAFVSLIEFLSLSRARGIVLDETGNGCAPSPVSHLPDRFSPSTQRGRHLRRLICQIFYRSS